MAASPNRSNASANDIHIVRVYNAPLAAVWSAWTDPAQKEHWWGPRGFTITTHTHDLRVGGNWRYTMHGPDGVDYPNDTKYLEVIPGKKLVYDHGGFEDRPPLFRVTVEFFEADGRTTMDMRMTLPTPEAARETAKFVKQVGGNGTWDRLAEHIDKQVLGKDCFVINRSFDAPLETMFEMWTDPRHFSRWLPPNGMQMEFIRCEIRPGGSGFYRMFGPGPDGKTFEMYGRVNYQEIRRPDRLVYTQQFCDAQENISRHPFAPTWPETMLTIVTLAAESPTQTRVTVEWEPIGTYTADELATFLHARAGMTGGWTGSFDKLEALLTRV